jgi:hypothetical protein
MRYTYGKSVFKGVINYSKCLCLIGRSRGEAALTDAKLTLSVCLGRK